jgi:flagellar biosynthesis regulator FlaF
MADKKNRQVLTISFPVDDGNTIAAYSYLKEHISTTRLVSDIILPQVKLNALISSGADEKDIKQAAIDTLNFSRQSMIDVLDSLALNNIQLPSEILLRYQNSLNNIILTNMSAPPVAMPPQQSIAPPTQLIALSVDQSEAEEVPPSTDFDDDDEGDNQDYLGEVKDVTYPLFDN